MRKKYRMMVDTTSLISGLVFHGVEHRLLKLVEKDKIKLVLSDHIVEETRRVLKRSFGGKASLLDEFLEITNPEIIKKEKYLNLIEKYKESIDDPKDVPILASGIKANPDFFISGDKHFKTEKVKKLLNVVTSRQILEKF